jgi:hypothetical protein
VTSLWDLGEDQHHEALVFVEVVRGRPVDGIAPTTEVPHLVEGWHVEPIGTSEQIVAAEQVTARWRASGPVTRVAHAGGKVVRAGGDGDELQIEGEPQHFDSGGPLDHTELVLVRWGGGPKGGA